MSHLNPASGIEDISPDLNGVEIPPAEPLAPNASSGDASALLSIDETPILINQAVQYLKSAGALNQFVRVIAQQHLLQDELRQRQDLAPTGDELEDEIVAYRSDQRLIDHSAFQRWLEAEKIDRAQFRERMRDRLKLQKLKIHIAETNIQEYFITQKVFLDEIILSRIVVRSESLAEELKFQIQEQSGNFERLAQEFSITEDRLTNGLIGRISRGQLPDNLRSHVDTAQPGDVIGPIQNEDLWYLIRVERFLPASLTDDLKQRLQDQLFEKWTIERIQQANIQLLVN